MSSSLKDLQCIAVRIDEDHSETPELPHLPSSNEPCWLVLLAGTPGSPAGRETPEAPVKLTAAQSGPCHWPANYCSSRLDSATQVEYLERGQTMVTKKQQTN